MIRFTMISVTKNPKETEKLAGFLLRKLLNLNNKKAIVVALEGELGAGKTVFVRGLAKALKIKSKIKSPTFNLMKHYQASSYNFYHFDCYRLKDHNDFKVMDLKEIFADPRNLILIEWAERVKKILPKNHIKVHIDHVDKNKRKITIK